MSGASPGGRFEYGGSRRGESPRARQDQRISTCKYCKLSIYRGQLWVWVNGNVTGMVHSECKPQ